MKTTKKDKPLFTVNLCDVENANDIYVCFALAKQAAGLPITNNEMDNLVRFITKTAKQYTYRDIFRGFNAVVIDDGVLHRMTAHKAKDEDNEADDEQDEQMPEQPSEQKKKPGFFKRLLRKFCKRFA